MKPANDSSSSHAAKPQTAKQWISDFLDREHFRYRGRRDARITPDEIAIDARWRVIAPAESSPLVRRMTEDFLRFSRECFGLTLEKSSAGASGPSISWRLEPERVTAVRLLDARDPWSFDRADPAVEAFALNVKPDSVTILAGHERGLLHGTHYLERLMADRGGPWLTPGISEHRPSMTPRLSNGVFVEPMQTIEHLGHFSDDYLSLMSHFGVNGIHVYVHLWEVCRNNVLPELNSPEFEHNIALLNAFNDRLLAHGIDLYLLVNTGTFPADHAVFKNHPKVRGSRVDIFLEQLENIEAYNLCSGNERVLECYRETLRNAFTAAPRLAGAAFIVGGESFFHCFTRPRRDSGGKTSCPHCHDLDASDAVARLSNVLAGAVREAGAHKPAFIWPYSAFVWSGEDRAQLRWIDGLSEDVSLLSNFDCGGEDKTNGAGVIFFDYNIKEIGPSPIFTAQAARRQAMGQPIFVKTESNTTPTAFFLPYLPVHQRWGKRFAAMRETGVAGYIGQWRFYGMNGSLPEELQYHAVWNPKRLIDDVLAAAATRDFAIDTSTAKHVVAGWKQLSDAWDSFPWSAMTCGERNAYMRGPFYLGPAHPLILNAQDAYNLHPKFRLLRGDAAEMLDADALREAVRTAKPRYVADLLFTLPFGVERYIELADRCLSEWSRGVANLDDAIGVNPNERARMELDVCRTIEIHLATLRNVARFYQQRDLLGQSPVDCERTKAIFANLSQIVRDEIANAERAVPILDRDPRIGFGHAYGLVYDAEMVRDKLRQCRYVLEKELPRLSAVIRFHVWNDVT